VWSPPALAVAAAAVAYLVVAFLFDVSSFPHTPYILMTLAGLLAVVVGRADEGEADPTGRAAAAADDRGDQRRPLLRAASSSERPRVPAAR
jgi:hypothetical protein